MPAAKTMLISQQRLTALFMVYCLTNTLTPTPEAFSADPFFEKTSAVDMAPATGDKLPPAGADQGLAKKQSDKGLKAVLKDNSVDPYAPPPPAPKDLESLVEETNRSSSGNASGSSYGEEKEPVLSGKVGESGGGDLVQVTMGGIKKRAVNVSSEVPSIRHVSMSPANSKYGVDELELKISPIYDMVIKMPEAIDFVKSSNIALKAEKIPGSPNLCVLKLAATIKEETPISLHIVDKMKNIYTFSIWAGPADLGWEYAKTVIINRRQIKEPTIGVSDEEMFFKGLGVEDAIQLTVGDIPLSNEYEIELVNTKYNPGYVQYNFRISWRNPSKFKPLNPQNLVYTIWSNDLRLDGGPQYSFSRTVEWRPDPGLMLSKIETRRRGRPTLRVSVQVKAGILDLEEWRTAFITVADESGFTRYDFSPLVRPFRAPHSDAAAVEEE